MGFWGCPATVSSGQGISLWNAASLRTAASLRRTVLWRIVGRDLALLEQTGILKAPPQWSYVKQALVRAGGDKERELDDRHAIQVYAAMLRDRGEQFDRALLVAAIGRTASNAQTPARRTQEALQALSETILREARLEPYGSTFHGSLAYPDALSRYREWAEVLAPKLDFPDLEQRSWTRWFGNFDLWWSRGDSAFPFEFEDYLLRVHGSGPPSLLSEDLAAMSVYQWTQLALLRSDIFVPPWLKGSAWHALGFDLAAVQSLGIGSTEESAIKAWASRVADAQNDGPPDYWVLVISDVGPARNWLPEKQYPAIAIRRSELSLLTPPPGLARGTLVELVGNLEAVKAAVDRPFPSIPNPSASNPPAYFGAVKLPKRRPGAPAYLYNPRSVGDAVRKLTTLHEHRTPSSRKSTPTDKAAATVTSLDIGALPEVQLAVGEQGWLTLVASKGTPPYRWVVTSGMVPPGMKLEHGVIEGIPTSPGHFQFTVRAFDAEGNFGDRMFPVSVVATSHRLEMNPKETLSRQDASSFPATSDHRSSRTAHLTLKQQ